MALTDKDRQALEALREDSRKWRVLEEQVKLLRERHLKGLLTAEGEQEIFFEQGYVNALDRVLGLPQELVKYLMEQEKKDAR